MQWFWKNGFVMDIFCDIRKSFFLLTVILFCFSKLEFSVEGGVLFLGHIGGHSLLPFTLFFEPVGSFARFF